MCHEQYKKEITIAMIDSGVDASHPALKGRNITAYTILEKKDSYSVQQGSLDSHGHGTAIASLLFNQLSNIALHVLSIYDETLFARPDKLVYSLNYIFEHIPCQIIHLSLGTSIDHPGLHGICRQLIDRGTIILAAFDNAGGISFPAAYPEVIGVDVSRRITNNNNYIFVKNSPVNLLARSGNQRLAWKNGSYIVSQGTSYALPYITAVIAKHIMSGVKPNEINKVLEENAFDVYCAPESEKNEKQQSISFNDAYIFPYNKETSSLLNYPDLLCFNISGILDVRESLNVGKKVRSIDGKHDYSIDNIDNHSFNPESGLIIGHVNELERLLGKDIKKPLLDKCLQSHTPVFMFDDYLHEEYRQSFSDNDIPLIYPRLSTSYGKPDRFGMLYRVSSPVLGVFGTTSKQGKYSLQLTLRRLFIKNGYTLAQLGTEPQSLLFGMDATYPYGYGSNIHLERGLAVQYLNQVMHELDSMHPDIVLIGAQSGTVPLRTDNLGQLPLQTHEFLLGTAPDAVVLCVNAFDKVTYIKRTIQFIENITGKTKVIALCLFPMTMRNGWQLMNHHKVRMTCEELSHIKSLLTEEIGLPVFINGTGDEMQKLFDLCCDFFS